MKDTNVDALLDAAKYAVMEWRLHGQLTDSCRVLEAAIARAEAIVKSPGSPTGSPEADAVKS